MRRGEFGTPGTTWNVGVGWAHASGTPFRFYKRTQHGGGVTTPFIAHWPAAITPDAKFMDQPCHVTDLLPTLIEIGGATYPADFGGKQHPPLPGRSFASTLTRNETLPPRTLHFALFNNLALIHDGWKIVTAYGRPWALYDLTSDRTETHDLAKERPEKLAELLALQKTFYARADVSLRLSSGERERNTRHHSPRKARKAPVPKKTPTTRLSRCWRRRNAPRADSSRTRRWTRCGRNPPRRRNRKRLASPRRRKRRRPSDLRDFALHEFHLCPPCSHSHEHSQHLPALALAAMTAVSSSFADEFTPVFNGRDLGGWRGMDGLWSVEDGAIVGQTTKDHPIESNTFLVWQGGEVADFEFTAKARFKGNNSGVQYRSTLLDPEKLVLTGYQLDMHPKPNFFGMLYGEKYGTRGKIATRGQRIEVGPDGKVNVLGTVGDESKFSDWEWNRVRIVAVGARLIHQVNGVTTIDVTDHDPSAMTKGKLGLQLHKGGPMRVEFKDLKLRALNAAVGSALLKEFASTDSTPAKPKGKGKAKAKKPIDAAEAEETGATPTGGAIKLNQVKIAKGFKIEPVYQVPREQGSWVSLTIDDKGRLLASDQGDKGLFRITLPSGGAGARVEKMPVNISGAQGMVWKDGQLFFFQSGVGLQRVTDTDGDDLLDRAELLTQVFGKGEHGTHGLLDAEDGTHILAVAGNQTPLPTSQLTPRHRVQSWQEDFLLPRQWDPRGHARGILAPGGWITRFDPAKKTHEVFA
ncbi:MAG: DUF1080 domain-containing protein, partial [Verrucomicrobiae bacterium]|nr:DUF1080 domain-containing protein [Verrucomicrobiae bacterium]